MRTKKQNKSITVTCWTWRQNLELKLINSGMPLEKNIDNIEFKELLRK